MAEHGSDPAGAEVDPLAEVPEWDDEYLDQVSDRLLHNYDLDRDRTVGGESFDLYGSLTIQSQKQFFHPTLNYANHETREHLYVRRADRVRVADLEALVDLGHDLGDEIEADERHQGTDFTFGLVVPDIPDKVREFVDGFRDRTLLKYGYYGHYEVNLFVVAPQREAIVASEETDVAEAFALWRELAPPEQESLLDRVRAWFRR